MQFEPSRSDLATSALPVRDSARVLLLGPDDRLLLVNYTGGGSDSPPFWGTLGGGLHRNDSFESAARREVLEETGIAKIDILGCVAVWLHELTLSRKRVLSRERFYVARSATSRVQSAKRTQSEQADFVRVAWWRHEQLTDLFIHPRVVPELLATFFRCGIPSPPKIMDDSGRLLIE